MKGRLVALVGVFCIASLIASGLIANGEEVQQADVIIKVKGNGSGGIIVDEKRAGDPLIPEVPMGKPFDVAVEWGKGTENLVLSISSFKTVWFDPGRDGNFPGDPLWKLGTGETGTLEATGKYVEKGVLKFDQKEGPSPKTLILEGDESPPYTPVLIMFKLTVSDEKGNVIFAIDPPWAKSG